MSINKAVRVVLKSTLMLKKKKMMAMSPWANRNVVLITENDLLPQEKSTLQIFNPKKNKVATVDVSNIVYVHPNIEDRTITIVLPDYSEIVFKAERHQLLILWIAALKVAMSKGTLFHVKYRSRDGMVDEDALLQFANISTQDTKNQDQILLLSSPLDDITRHAWRVSQIRQFRITDLGISIEFCHNCYRTHLPRYRSFNLFVHTSVMNACVEFICRNTQATACVETLNNFITIYRIQNHHCPILNPPSTPPPPVPSVNSDDRPPVPSRDYPRFSYLSGPCAKPRLKHPNLVSPYRITNKIVINDDGSVSRESTILGHRGNALNPNPLQPPRKQHNKTNKAENFPEQKIMLHALNRNRSGKLLPPKDIKRTSALFKYIPKPAPTHPMSDDDNDNDDKAYQESWITVEDYVHMYPGLFQPPLPPGVVDNEESCIAESYVHMCPDLFQPPLSPGVVGNEESCIAESYVHMCPDLFQPPLSPGVVGNEESCIAESYVHMCPDLFQPPVVDNLKASHNNSKGAKNLVQTVDQVSVAPTGDSHSPSVDSSDDELDFIDREYINIQNILIELDVKSVQISQGRIKPPIKKRTFKLIKTESEPHYRPHVKPRKISLNLPASPKPIPRRRTTTSSHVSPICTEFDFSEQLKKVDLNVTHDEDTNDEEVADLELTSQLDIDSASPEDNDNVFTENATTPHSSFPLGYVPGPTGDTPQPISSGSDQLSHQEQASIGSDKGSNSSSVQQADALQQPNDKMITRHTSAEESKPETETSSAATCADLSNKIV